MTGWPLVRHLQEQRVGEMLGVVDDADPVVPQDVTVAHQFVDEAADVSGHVVTSIAVAATICCCTGVQMSTSGASILTTSE